MTTDLRGRIDELESALRWALTFISQSREPPDSGEDREDYCGATRIAWPDDPDQWEPEDQPGGADMADRYEHRRLYEHEQAAAVRQLGDEWNLPVGIFYDGHLVAVVIDDSQAIASGIAGLLNAIGSLAHVTQPQRDVPEPRDPTHVTQPPEES